MNQRTIVVHRDVQADQKADAALEREITPIRVISMEQPSSEKTSNGDVEGLIQ